MIILTTAPPSIYVAFVATLAKVEYLSIGSPWSWAIARIVFKFLEICDEYDAIQVRMDAGYLRWGWIQLV